MFCKKGVLRNFAKFTGKHLCQSIFLNKVLQLYKKETLAQVFSCEFCEIFEINFFHRTPLVAASNVTASLSRNLETFNFFWVPILQTTVWNKCYQISIWLVSISSLLILKFGNEQVNAVLMQLYFWCLNCFLARAQQNGSCSGNSYKTLRFEDRPIKLYIFRKLIKNYIWKCTRNILKLNSIKKAPTWNLRKKVFFLKCWNVYFESPYFNKMANKLVETY